jgi:phosphoribosyl-ATP pyrophosphohydrolase
MDKAKVILDLFSAQMFTRMRPYAPSEQLYDREKAISGRLLEENIELHLKSGGTPQSAMSHVMDAIANEAFKIKRLAKTNQAAYPSNFESSYDEDGVIEELADSLFVFMVNMIVNRVEFYELKKVIESKIEKLEKARVEGKLHITDRGLFYIQKD